MNFPERAALHQAIDQLKPDSLVLLAEYIDYLRYREQQLLPPGESNWSMKLTDLFSPIRETVDQAPEPLPTPVKTMLEGLLNTPVPAQLEAIPEPPVPIRTEINRLADELDRLATDEHRWVAQDGFGKQSGG